jgi:predicted PurR-regulated permease PerM
VTTESEISKERLLLKRALEVGIRIGLLLLLVVWSFEIVRPFIVPVIWGIILAVATYPAYRRLDGALGGRSGLAATLITILLLVLLAGPMTMLAGTLIESARELAAQLREGQLQIPPPPESVVTWPVIGQPLAAFWELASVNLEEALERIGPQIKAVGVWLLAVAGGVGFGLLQFVFAIVISGVLLAYAKGGERAADAIAVRLIGEQGPKFADLAGATVRSVSRGILGVALIQAILAGLGFLAVGLPAAGLLALLCLFLAVIQIGIAVVTIPAIIYIFATADTHPAVLFLVWAVFVTALDNVLKPILLGRGVQVPMAIIFVGAIGGFLAHGIIGLFVGSVVLALGYTLFRAWLRESREPEPAADAPAAANGPAARPGEP